MALLQDTVQQHGQGTQSAPRYWLQAIGWVDSLGIHRVHKFPQYCICL